MSYIDEEILKQQIAAQQKKEEEDKLKGSVAEGVIWVKGQEIRFEEKEFLDGQLKLMVPEDLKPMTEAEINGAYLMGNRPQFLFKSGQAGISFVLNHTENPVADHQTVQMAGIAGRLLERATMNGKIFKKHNIERDGKTIAIIELVTNGLDDSIYTLNFYISLQERLLLGNVSCQAKGMDIKKDIAMQMLETIKINEKSKEV